MPQRLQMIQTQLSLKPESTVFTNTRLALESANYLTGSVYYGLFYRQIRGLNV